MSNSPISPATLSRCLAALREQIQRSSVEAEGLWRACEAIDARLAKPGQMSHSARRRGFTDRANAAEQTIRECGWALTEMERLEIRERSADASE